MTKISSSRLQTLFRLKGTALRPGDLVFSTDPKGLKSRIIRMGGQFSHVALHINNGLVLEAVGKPGVICRDVCRVFWSSPDIVAVKRPRLTEEQRQKIVNAALQAGLVGYNVFGAATYRLPKPSRGKKPKRFFCSQLVAWAYESAGHKLIERKPGGVHPNDLYAINDLDLLAREEILESMPREFVDSLFGLYDTEHKQLNTALERFQEHAKSELARGVTVDSLLGWFISEQLRVASNDIALWTNKRITEATASLLNDQQKKFEREQRIHSIEEYGVLIKQQEEQDLCEIKDQSVRRKAQHHLSETIAIANRVIKLLKEDIKMLGA